MRVDESRNSRSRLARNSHPLSDTLIDSRELSTNLNLLKFFMRVGESFVSFGRAREFKQEFYCQQLLFFFSNGLRETRKKQYGGGFGDQG